MSKEERLDYLEDERQKIWQKITEMEDLLNKKTSDYEAAAKQEAEQTKLYRESSENDQKKIAEDLVEASGKLEGIRTHYKFIEDQGQRIAELIEAANRNSESITSIQEKVTADSSVVQQSREALENLLNDKPLLDEKIKNLQEIFSRGDDYDSKLGILFKNITDRKKEIDNLYYQVIGYTQTDKETGNETKVPGQKDELDQFYAEAKNNMHQLDAALVSLQTETQKKYHEFIQGNVEEFSGKMKEWQDRYNEVQVRIHELLPEALTTGLSFAYSKKKEDEETENKKHQEAFNWGIWGLIIVSLIPFAVSLNSIYNNISLEEVILRIPRIVVAILPLYIPVLWVAYSSNRKMNLSKRLIEEYTHKEVLSKTFEGLSKQISDIKDSDISSDLRNKLLYNILEVNSENPGKLISDYNKSDHPLMDALDKSIKLTNSVAKLARIPGFTKLAGTIAKKSDELYEKQKQKAEEGLDMIAGEGGEPQ